MTYQEARRIKDKSLKYLITQNIVSGEGFGSSVGTAISDKFKARAKRFKAKFDPLNVARMLTGSLGAAVVGRLTGRKQEDIEYFTGKRGRTKRGYYKNVGDNQSIDTQAFYTTISDGAIEKVKTGDNVADILTKMLNFMKRIHKEEVLAMELNRDLENRNYAIVSKNKDKNVFEKVTDKEKDESWLAKLLPKLIGALAALGSIYSALKGLLKPFSDFFSKLKFPEMPTIRFPDVRPPTEKAEVKETEKTREGEAEKEKQRRKSSKDDLDEDISKLREYGVRGGSALVGSKAVRLLETLDKTDIKKLKRNLIDFDEDTETFIKKLGNTSRRISAKEVAKLLGKEVPVAELPSMINEQGRFGKAVKSALQQLKLSQTRLQEIKSAGAGKIVANVTEAGVKTLSYIAVLVGIFAMAVEIVELIMEYNNDPKMTSDELEEGILEIVVATMTEFGVSSVIFFGIDAILSVTSATFLGPFAVLAPAIGAIGAAVGTAMISVKFGGNINASAKEFTREVFTRFVNRDKITALKESVFNKPLKTVEDFDNFQREMAKLTGQPFTPIDRNSAGFSFLKKSAELEMRAKAKSLGGLGTKEGEKLRQEFLKEWGDGNDLDQKSKDLKDGKLSLNDIKPIIIDNSKNVQVGKGGVEPVLFETNVSLRTDDPSMIKAQKLSLRLV